MKSSDLRPYLIRLAIVLAISLVFALVFNEASYLLTKDPADRAPKTISLVIPAGTAARIKAGDELRIFPDEITFVVGDILEVVNEDSEPHQMGRCSCLRLNWHHGVFQAKDAADCTFRAAATGLDIRPATTVGRSQVY
jgi:hypothetical protein